MQSFTTAVAYLATTWTYSRTEFNSSSNSITDHRTDTNGGAFNNHSTGASLSSHSVSISADTIQTFSTYGSTQVEQKLNVINQDLGGGSSTFTTFTAISSHVTAEYWTKNTTYTSKLRYQYSTTSSQGGITTLSTQIFDNFSTGTVYSSYTSSSTQLITHTETSSYSSSSGVATATFTETVTITDSTITGTYTFTSTNESFTSNSSSGGGNLSFTFSGSSSSSSAVTHTQTDTFASSSFSSYTSTNTVTITDSTATSTVTLSASISTVVGIPDYTTAESTVTFDDQVTTVNHSTVQPVRVTRTTTQSYYSTSLVGTTPVTYAEISTVTTSTKSHATVTQDGRMFSTITNGTRLNSSVLSRTLAFAENGFYVTSTVIGTITFYGTGGNEVLYVPSTNSAGLNDLGSLASTADSTTFGSWSIAPASMSSFPLSSISSTHSASGSSASSTTASGSSKTYISLAQTFTIQSLNSTATSNSFTFHSTRITASTTSTSAAASPFLPFATNSTTTSITGIVETYTVSSISWNTLASTYDAGFTTDTNMSTNAVLTYGPLTTSLINTITSTIKVPGTYHMENVTSTVVTTVLSFYTFVSFSNNLGPTSFPYNSFFAAYGELPNGEMGAGRPPNMISLPSQSMASSATSSQQFSNAAFGETRLFTTAFIGSTSEAQGLNGVMVRVDTAFAGKFAAQAGGMFNVDPCMAIGFRPATNDQQSAPIYFSPTFAGIGTLSEQVYSKFTTSTASGTTTTATTSATIVSAATTQSTIPFSRITLHQGVSASIFVSNIRTDSSTYELTYSSAWVSYTSYTTTATISTTATSDASTASTTSASSVSAASPFLVTESSTTLFSGNTIFITRSAPQFFITNEGGNKYFSHDERYTPAQVSTSQTMAITINFGASIANSTHYRNESGVNPTTPPVYGGFHPVSSQTGLAVLVLDPNTTYQTSTVVFLQIPYSSTASDQVIGAAYMQTVFPRTGGAGTTSLITTTFYRRNSFELLLTNDLSNMIAIEPVTLFSWESVDTFYKWTDLLPFYTQSKRMLIDDSDIIS